jgi:hypothetical protein
MGGSRGDWEEAVFLTLGKLPEALGVVGYALNMYRTKGHVQLIEYK